MSDSDYSNNEGYLEDQTKFAEKDRVGEDEKLIPFTNGLDKGYRGKWRHGRMGNKLQSNHHMLRVTRGSPEGKQSTLDVLLMTVLGTSKA